jgi:hypothetical protein
MVKRLQVVDRFYPKPENVRQKALSMKYAEPIDLIGWRTPIWQPRGIKSLIERSFRIQIEYWEDDLTAIESSNGVFFSAFSEGRRAEKLKVHFDEPPDWMSLLVYLTPNAAFDTGTSFWQHRETGLIAKPTKRDALRLGLRPEELETMLEGDGWKRKCWIEIDRVGNVFNRAVIFPAGLFHSATHHFGNNLNNGRLYQSFHFPIESKSKNC